jgi:plastocyanin
MRDRARRFATTLGLALAVLLLAACTTSSGGSDEPSPATDADRTITSRGLVFDVATLAVPAGATFSLQLTNLDAAPHNVAIYEDSSAGDDVFVGEVITSSSIVYQVPALEPGSYFFRCDVHPDMNGELVAS